MDSVSTDKELARIGVAVRCAHVNISPETETQIIKQVSEHPGHEQLRVVKHIIVCDKSIPVGRWAEKRR